MKRQTLAFIFSLLLLVTFIGAAPHIGAAIFSHRAPIPQAPLPRPVRFRETRARGLLLQAWVNGVGPYTFALDTGAGAIILSPRVASEAQVARMGRRVKIAWFDGRRSIFGEYARLRSLAVGDPDNRLPAQGTTIIAALPEGVDGLLDPTEGYWPLGYIIDMPRGELGAFDPRREAIENGEAEAAILRWLPDREGRRPFVQLANGRPALLDTGSRFGLALSRVAARAMGIVIDAPREARVLRLAPMTLELGSLVLRNVPADLIVDADEQTPILLGREALRPFRLLFDPQKRLIRIDLPRKGRSAQDHSRINAAGTRTASSSSGGPNISG